jgi:hypothetical protein
MNLSAALIGKNASVDIASASYNCAPTVRQGSECYTAINSSMLFLNGGLRRHSLQSVLVFNMTNMHAMSDRSDYFPCSSTVNISEPAICFTVSLFSAVSRVVLPSFWISTAMSDTQYLDISLLEVIISSKNERVFIRDLSDLTVQITFDAWSASMNVGSKRHVAWKNSRHAPSWQFYLNCGIEETSSPGIISIVCQQVLRHPSEHGTSSIGKHLLAKAHIAKLNELTESEVTELTSSTVDETALTILRRQGSRGITTVHLQRKTIFDIQFDQYWPKWQAKSSKLADRDFETSDFHQDTWNHYLMLGVVSVNIPWNAISDLELQQSYKA